MPCHCVTVLKSLGPVSRSHVVSFFTIVVSSSVEAKKRIVVPLDAAELSVRVVLLLQPVDCGDDQNVLLVVVEYRKWMGSVGEKPWTLRRPHHCASTTTTTMIRHRRGSGTCGRSARFISLDGFFEWCIWALAWTETHLTKSKLYLLQYICDLNLSFVCEPHSRYLSGYFCRGNDTHGRQKVSTRSIGWDWMRPSTVVGDLRFSVQTAVSKRTQNWNSLGPKKPTLSNVRTQTLLLGLSIGTP
jgi:hypothetical protein